MKTTHKHILLLILASALWTIAGTGCNTFRGFGKDMENAGNQIQKAD